MMNTLFGTDGIRGVANEYPMTPEMAVKIGKAVTALFRRNTNTSKIVIGKDTRVSGDMFECALASGICSVGGDAYLSGILPTPGVAFLTKSIGADAGIVISASHNPFYDNGIKIFNTDGYKLSDAKETEIEQLVLDKKTISRGTSSRDTGRVHQVDDAVDQYAYFIKSQVNYNNYFEGLSIVLDCANGATFRVAPAVFRGLGADVEVMFARPDGKNINEKCGSQYPEALIKRVKEKKADIGLAFDGDGDRLIAVDEKGAVATGDQILAVCAAFMKQNGLLKNNRVVSTVMSNMGLGAALNKMGITHTTSKVGDRYVMEEMVATGAALGGEDSGHLIFLDPHTTGDGIFSALKLIEAMQQQSKPLSELCKVMTVFPQVLINVAVKQKPDITTVPALKHAIESVEASLGKKGRVLVRYSGTEAKCRVMVEGPTMDETQRYCRHIADIAKKTLGK
jgi:phosphoglucosamine mutase